MKIPFLTFFLLLVTSTLYGQNLFRKQADSLLNQMPGLNSNRANAEPILQLAMFFIRKDGEFKVDLDSATYFIKKARSLAGVITSDRLTGFFLLAESQLNDELGNKEIARQLAEKAIKRLKLSKDLTLLGKAYYELGRYYNNYDDEKQVAVRISLVDSAVNCLRYSADKVELATDLQMLGDLQSSFGSIDKSQYALHWGLKVFRSTGYQKLQGIYVLLSSNYNFLSNYGEALSYGLLALKACHTTKDTSAQLTEIENNIGNVYHSLGNEDKAVKYFHDALQNSRHLKDTAAVYTIMPNICRVYMRINQPVKALNVLNEVAKMYKGKKAFFYEVYFELFYFKIYTALRNYAAAKVYFDDCKLLLQNPQLQNIDQRIEIYMALAFYLKDVNRFHEAFGYCTLLEKATLKSNNYRRMQAYKIHYQLDSALHSYKSAFLYAVKYKDVNDSIFTEKKNKQIQELQITYQSKEKDNSIIFLSQKTKLQQDEIGKAVRARNETIAGICILLIGGGAFTRQYRIRQKAFRIIKKQNDMITVRNEEIIYKNDVLEGLIKEKEYLVLEIHHRVKNNLQTTMSLLNMQSANISDKKALNVIKDSQRRMHTMSLIHHRLYQSDSVGLINMEIYINELVVYLSESFINSDNIYVKTEARNIQLDVSFALPLGLIINEAVTNAFKYAFPNRHKGKISVTLLEDRDGYIELAITDDGVGFATIPENQKISSLGMKLMQGLTDQIGGSFILKNDMGTKIIIQFKNVCLQD